MGCTESTTSPSVSYRGVRIVLPFPTEMYEDLRHWEDGEDTRMRAQYTAFVNNKGLLRAVFHCGYDDFVKFAEKVLRHFNTLQPFVKFWDELPYTIYSKTYKKLLVSDRGVISKYTRIVSMDGDQVRVREEVERAVEQGVSLFFPLLIQKFGHVNTGVLKYIPETNTLVCVVLEPFAARGKASRTANHILAYMTKNLDGVTVRVVGTDTREGLQQKSYMCSQWASLMFFTYMLTCEVGGGCRDAGPNVSLVVEYFFTNRHFLMSVWMFYMQQTMRLKPIREAETLAWDRAGGNNRVFHEFDETDAYNCQSRSRATCTSPCGINKGKCVNENLFPTNQGKKPPKRDLRIDQEEDDEEQELDGEEEEEEDEEEQEEEEKYIFPQRRRRVIEEDDEEEQELEWEEEEEKEEEYIFPQEEEEEEEDDEEEQELEWEEEEEKEEEYIFPQEEEEENDVFEERNPNTNRRWKTCRDDQERNPNTNRCRKTCRDDQERNPDTNRCRKTCRDDQERNPNTNRCRKK